MRQQSAFIVPNIATKYQALYMPSWNVIDRMLNFSQDIRIDIVFIWKLPLMLLRTIFISHNASGIFYQIF